MSKRTILPLSLEIEGDIKYVDGAFKEKICFICLSDCNKRRFKFLGFIKEFGEHTAKKLYACKNCFMNSSFYPQVKHLSVE